MTERQLKKIKKVFSRSGQKAAGKGMVLLARGILPVRT